MPRPQVTPPREAMFRPHAPRTHRVEFDERRMTPPSLGIRAGDTVEFVPKRGTVRQTLRIVNAEAPAGANVVAESSPLGGSTSGAPFAHTFRDMGYFTVMSDIYSFVNADVAVHHPDWTPSGASTPMRGTGYSTGRTSRSGQVDLTPLLEAEERLTDPTTFRRDAPPAVAPREVLQSPGQRKDSLRRSQNLLEEIRAKAGVDGQEPSSDASQSYDPALPMPDPSVAQTASQRLRTRMAAADLSVELAADRGRGQDDARGMGGFVASSHQAIQAHQRIGHLRAVATLQPRHPSCSAIPQCKFDTLSK